MLIELTEIEKEYEENMLMLPIYPEPDTQIKLFSSVGTLLAINYNRIVVGGRGAYFEFSSDQIIIENFIVRPEDKWRFKSDCFYIEYHSNDVALAKLYYQRKLVDYADYVVGLYYISPFDLFFDDGKTCIKILGNLETF